jgi:hypothetical protein
VNPDYDFAIVGAGVCGLTLAHRLRDSHQTVKLIEKSRGAGGRLCTRKWDDKSILFDHGAQGIPETERVKSWLSEFELLESGLLQDSPQNFAQFQNRWRVPGGISKLGRKLAEDLDVNKQVRIQSVSKMGQCYRLQSEEGDTFFASSVILTMPLPQVELLLEHEDSDLGNCPEELKAIQYKKSVVFLAQVEQGGPALERDVYVVDGFQIMNMAKRHNLQKPALAVFAPEGWSEDNYEDSPEQLTIGFQTLLNRAGIGGIQQSQVHKWRYAFTEGIQRDPAYLKLQDHDVFIAGEGLAHGGVDGAIFSADSLSKELLLTP